MRNIVADSVNPDLPSNPIIVDALCVPSEIAKVRWTEKEYVISGNVVVTGNPAYDKLCNLPKAERTSIIFCQQASKLNTNINVWENLGETRIFEHFDQWEEIANRIDTLCEVRLHPTINTYVFFKWKANERKKLELDTEPNTGISLSTRKVIIGNLSTILTEALYAKTPVIQYLYEGEVDTLDAFVKMGIVKSVRLNDINGITEIIQKTVKGEVSFTK